MIEDGPGKALCLRELIQLADDSIMQIMVAAVPIENYQDDPIHSDAANGEVHEILPDGPNSSQSAKKEDAVLANDTEAVFKKILDPVLPKGLEIEAQGTHTWKIEHWRDNEERAKLHSPSFEVGGAPWKILFFPYGNNSADCASLYLEHGFTEKPAEDWYACVQFGLVMWNANDPSIWTHNEAQHRYTGDESDWGFTRFVRLREIFQQPWKGHTRTMVEGDEVNITAYVRVIKDPIGVLWHNFQNYDSKKMTGFVGLRNQGATCYLNSLIQSLYFTNAFRKAIYQIPTEDGQTVQSSAYTLQRLFFLLQTSSDAVTTNELTKSFGWETRHIFEQQDVQELSRKLMERMEIKMKGTAAENALERIFVGKTKTYISCVDVDYESSRVEDFWDVQLNVSNNKNLDDSFRDYIQVETMDGENKYFAESHGLQDAKKGVIFESFPQVLHLQLKRFEYDFNRDAMMKVNDRHEFPETFDASPYLSQNADFSEPWIYKLHGVLVHSGDFNAGHYYAFLKPEKDGHWFKFDDDRVTRTTMNEVLEDNYGGEYGSVNGSAISQRNVYTRTISTKKSMSAYMLVYIRETRLGKILSPITLEDAPAHIARTLNEERLLREQKKKERDEQHLYQQVRLITDDTFRSWDGTDLGLWELDYDQESRPGRAIRYRVLRKKLLKDFLKHVQTDLGYESMHLRPWILVNRQNKTVRPDTPIDDHSVTMERLLEKYSTPGARQDLRLWIETAPAEKDAPPPWPTQGTVDGQPAPLLVFLKYFDPHSQALRGMGHIYVKKQDRVADLATPVCKLLNWPADTVVKLFEEIKPSMIEVMKPRSSLQAAEIQDGDIICIQRTLADQELQALAAAGKYGDAREYYDDLLHQVKVMLAPWPDQHQDLEQFEIDLSKRMVYNQFTAKIANHLGIKPTHLRLYTVNNTTGNPKAVLKSNTTANLKDLFLTSYSSYGGPLARANAFYYEILDMPLSEYEAKRKISLIWLSEGVTKETPIDLLIPKEATVADAITMLQQRLKLEDVPPEEILVYQTRECQITKRLLPGNRFGPADDRAPLYATVYSDAEERKAAAADPEGRRNVRGMVKVMHFAKEVGKPHGVPFLFPIVEGEPMAESRKRLERRSGIKGKAFEKIRVAIIPPTTMPEPIYLADGQFSSPTSPSLSLLPR